VGALQQVGEAEFQSEVIASTVPVVIDFFAVWCGPCRMITPVLEDLSKTYAGKLKFVKVDIDEAPAIAEQLSVANVPTLMIFKDGQEVDRRVGAAPKPVLDGWIKTFA
jgi:thioredoxin